MKKKPKTKIPQSHKKALEYFNHVCSKPDFHKAVWEIRAKYIPNRIGEPGEFEDNDDDEPSFYPLAIQEEDASLEFYREEITTDIEDKILKKYELNNGFFQALWYYIFCDLDLDMFIVDNLSIGLCKVEDLKLESTKENSAKSDSNELSSYPLAIKLSAYASENDIRDFIAKEFTKTIKPIQDKYKNDKIKLGKIKVRNELKARRNQLIWSLRDKPRKDIAKVVKERTGKLLDQGLIGKIISLEKQRRKEL